MRITLKAALICLAAGLLQTPVFGQEAVKPRPSPTAIVTVKYEDTYVKVTYSQPHKRGREIFGKLVPYGQIWRTGANEAEMQMMWDNTRVSIPIKFLEH